MGETSLITNIEGWVIREITLSNLIFPEIMGDQERIDGKIGMDDMVISDDVQDASEMYSQALYWLDDRGAHKLDLVREELERSRENEAY